MRKKTLFFFSFMTIFFGIGTESASSNVFTQDNFSTEPGLYTGLPYVSSCYYFPVISSTYDGNFVKAADINVDAQYKIIDETPYYIGCGTTYKNDPPEPAVKLSSEGAHIPLTFQNLSPGVYFIRIAGRVNQAVIPRIRKPLYVHLKINDGPGGEINDYRMRVNYDKTIQETGRIFFYALNETNNLNAELYVGPGSQEELLVHRIDFFDALAGTDKKSYKTQPGTYTSAEREYLRKTVGNIANQDRWAKDENGKNYGDYKEWRWVHDPYVDMYTKQAVLNLSAEERKKRDDRIWNALPPLNSMLTGIDNLTFYSANHPPFPDGIATMADFEAQYGKWELDLNGYNSWNYPFDVPWRLINRKLNLEYTYDDYLNHRTLPDPYPWKDDGFGYYYPSVESQSTYGSPGSYYFIIPGGLFSRVKDYFGSIVASNGGMDGGLDLALRYHSTGNTAVARDASLMLVRMALQWPALQEAQDLGINSADPELEWNMRARWEARRVGKYFYSGWSDFNAQGLLTAYDQLFDFIDGNQEFANTVNGYIPWIHTPDDVIKMLDTNIIQNILVDAKIKRIEFSAPMLAGLVQNPSPVSDPLMDISKSNVGVYPKGMLPFINHYYNSFSQDGTMFIGSSMYVIGESSIFLRAIDFLNRYIGLGGAVPFNLNDIDKYPKIKSYVDTMLDWTVAGGYRMSVGDVGGAPYASRSSSHISLSDTIRDMWKTTKDSRAAWLIKNIYGGRKTESDSEWNEIDNAASNRRDPRLSTSSRVLEGFGVGILENGVSEEDYRKKSALVIRTGTGQGHVHNDALDLGVFSHGLRMAGDFAQRDEGSLFTLPPSRTSYVHNTVEIDGYNHPWKSQEGWPPGSFSAADAWVTNFKPLDEDIQFMSAEGKSLDHPNVSVFNRTNALVKLDDANSYVFDVFRVGGGKWHTWAFHGADCGVEDGGFTVNSSLEPVGVDTGKTSDKYLRKHANGRKYEGVASDKVEAVWRLSRTSSTTNECNADGTCLEVKTVAAEQSMLGADYDEKSPRKYTKISLFDRGGDNLMVGNLFSQSYNMNIPNLYVQSRQSIAAYSSMTEKENVYPALIETYAGSSLIRSSRMLSISGNETDALKAVAMEVETINGRSDVVISDGRRKSRSIDGGRLVINGTGGFYSENNSVFSEAILNGGTELSWSNASIKPIRATYAAAIDRVDYANRKIYTLEQLPEYNLDGEEFHIFNADHHSSYSVSSVRNDGAGSVLTIDHDSSVGMLAVKGISDNVVATPDSMALDTFANRNKGLTAANEAGTKTWKIERKGTGQYALIGGAASDGDFTDVNGDGIRSVMVYDFGFGDTVEVLSHAYLKKTAANEYIIKSNVPVDLAFPATEQKYIILDAVLGKNISGENCVSGVCRPSVNGQITFRYTPSGNSYVPHAVILSDTFDRAYLRYSLVDFVRLLYDWKKTISGSLSDLNLDGLVDAKDLGTMMSRWE